MNVCEDLYVFILKALDNTVHNCERLGSRLKGEDEFLINRIRLI